jgi:hypothetical protein
MKISNLSTLQFIGIMVALLVGVAIVFRYIEKKMDKKKTTSLNVPIVTTTPVTEENTTIDTSNGLSARFRLQ